RDALDTVSRLGPRAAESAIGQYATFERIRPGYYGERGAMMLFQSLLSLYPSTQLEQARDTFAPLSVIAFLQSVLIPEAALALIMEDRNSTRQEALATLRASGAYGFAMFSAD
ncbi:hypothetical protein AURDEDRAFT_22100, partial [Auricularia subglabra TFB-10046 SS5]